MRNAQSRSAQSPTELESEFSGGAFSGKRAGMSLNIYTLNIKMFLLRCSNGTNHLLIPI